jgi:hypothetical protein
MVERYGGWYDRRPIERGALRPDRRCGVQSAAVAAAEVVARACRAAVTDRGRARSLLSAEARRWLMLTALRDLEVPWPTVHVTEWTARRAGGRALRNLTRLEEILAGPGRCGASHLRDACQ